MAIERVTLPREVADAIELMRDQGATNFGIMRRAHGATSSVPDLTIWRWAFYGDGKGSSNKLMSALINGYEVEKTPEERVRRYYDRLYEQGKASIDRKEYKKAIEWGEKRTVVVETLDLLGITIEGVNASKSEGVNA